ncbi:hypothetical protein NEOKW01_0514 [Nematocida sp. AWRm80]|nr:hypothetical protein NEOKW01_0514 [Nematocida sp. AWRm80]
MTSEYKTLLHSIAKRKAMLSYINDYSITTSIPQISKQLPAITKHTETSEQIVYTPNNNTTSTTRTSSISGDIYQYINERYNTQSEYKMLIIGANTTVLEYISIFSNLGIMVYNNSTISHYTIKYIYQNNSRYTCVLTDGKEEYSININEYIIDNTPDTEYTINRPRNIYTIPEKSTIGITETKAIETAVEHRILKTKFRGLFYSVSERKLETEYKIIISTSAQNKDKVIGLELSGDSSISAMKGFAIAINLGLTIKEVGQTLPIHPTSSEEIIMGG